MNNPTRYQQVIEPTSSPASCRLLLADDHTLLRQGVKALIETYGVTVVGEAGDGREAVRIAEDAQPDVATVIQAFLAKSEIPSDPLTIREREVLQLVAQGMTTKKVAGLLGVSVKTAESHRHRIMDKLDLHDTASLVRYSIRRRLIEP